MTCGTNADAVTVSVFAPLLAGNNPVHIQELVLSLTAYSAFSMPSFEGSFAYEGCLKHHLRTVVKRCL